MVGILTIQESTALQLSWTCPKSAAKSWQIKPCCRSHLPTQSQHLLGKNRGHCTGKLCHLWEEEHTWIICYSVIFCRYMLVLWFKRVNDTWYQIITLPNHSEIFWIDRQRKIIRCSNPPSHGFSQIIAKDRLMGWAKRQRHDFPTDSLLGRKFPADSDIWDRPGAWKWTSLTGMTCVRPPPSLEITA